MKERRKLKDRRVKERRAVISGERRRFAERRIRERRAPEIPKTLKEFKTWNFKGTITVTEDFKAFAKLFFKEIKNKLPEGAKLIAQHTCHYFLSGFITKNGKYVYFSISDVRLWRNEWWTNILIRRAKNEKDYTGEKNYYTTLDEFTESVEKLLS